MKTKKALGGLLGLLGSLSAFVFLGFLPVRSGPFFTESLESIERTNQEITIRSPSPVPASKHRSIHRPNQKGEEEILTCHRPSWVHPPSTCPVSWRYLQRERSDPSQDTDLQRKPIEIAAKRGEKVGIYLRSALFGGR